MKLTARSMRAHPRAMACCELPLESKKDAIRDRVPITMVQRAMRGVEKNRDRTRLIVSPQSYQQKASRLAADKQGAGDEDGVIAAGDQEQADGLVKSRSHLQA